MHPMMKARQLPNFLGIKSCLMLWFCNKPWYPTAIPCPVMGVGPHLVTPTSIRKSFVPLHRRMSGALFAVGRLYCRI